MTTSLTGCLGGGGAANAGSEGSATEGTITWWGWTPTPELAEQYISAFNEEYPDITVHYRYFGVSDDYVNAMRPALAGSEGPDVFGISGGKPTSNIDTYGHAAVDLEPAIEEALGADWQDEVSQSGIDTFTTEDGKVGGLSLGDVAAGNLWINQDIFDEYDLEPPTDLASWKQVCEELRSHDVGCLAAGAGQGIFNLDVLHSISDTIDPEFFNDAARQDESWDDPRFVQALEIFQQLQDDGIMDPGALGLQQYPDANNMFLSQESAMIQMGTWYRQYTTQTGARAGIEGAGVGDSEPFTMIPIPYPDVAGQGNTGLLYKDPDVALGVSTSSDVQAAATTFVTWLATSNTGQTLIANSLDQNPALAEATPDWDAIDLVDPQVQQPALEALLEMTRASDQPRNALLNADVATAIQDASIAVLDGTMTPEDAAASVQAAAEGS
ncbi:ABC transporter substrate-binding protein [Georgenia deserti]|uniref:ABC transporter substrate-binding protein n=1 Tax=Georgenia deserti TaxID=2093781 RepID=A0ABW4L0C6_9MICO